MNTKTETTHAGDFIISEANGNRSRESGTLISGQNLAAGTVVGKITASGKYTQYNNDASDGSNVAGGILYAAIDASGGDALCAVIARDAEVNSDQLTWPNDSPLDLNAGIADLLAVGIIIR